MKFYLILFTLLSACSSVKVTDYKEETPKLVLENYLNGTLEAHGFFQDRSGLIVKRFKVNMKSSWSN